MKKIIYFFFFVFIVFVFSCKKDSNPISNENNPPPTSDWVLIYHDYNLGTLSCTFPNACLMDVVTDTLDLFNCDSMKINMSYHSIVNNNLTITKVPYPVEIYNCVFPDSAYGKLYKVFKSYNAKILLDFGFEIGTRFTIDTLQIYKK